MTGRRTARGWRWRCALCVGFGFDDSEAAALAGFEKHYQQKHASRDKAA